MDGGGRLTIVAVVPRPRRDARSLHRRQEEGHGPGPRPPPARILEAAGQGPPPRDPARRPGTVGQQAGGEEDQGGWRCR